MRDGIEQRLVRVERLIADVQQELDRIAKALHGIVSNQRELIRLVSGRTVLPNVETLPQKAEEVFAKMEKIAGVGAAARLKAEALLASLENEPVTMPIVKRLQSFLRERQWGLLCSCGVAAAPLWQRDAGCAQRGYMRYSHGGTKQFEAFKHGCFTRFPSKEKKLQIVERTLRQGRRPKA